MSDDQGRGGPAGPLPEGGGRVRRGSGAWTFLTDLSLGRRPAVLLALLLLIAGGIMALADLRRELFPDVRLPVVSVTTIYPGADPNSVATQVTVPLEDALTGVRGLKAVQSISESGVSIVVAQFEHGTPMDETLSRVTQAVGAIDLPDAAEAPRVEEVGLDEIPTLRLSLVRRGGDDTGGLRHLAEDVVLPELERIEGVQRVDVTGGEERRLLVELDADKLAPLGLSPSQVASALRASNVVLPAGEVARDGRDLQVRVRNELTSLEAVRDLPLPAPPAAVAGMNPGQPTLGGANATDPAAADATASSAGRPGTSPAVPARTGDAAESPPQAYVVQPGDTLESIAAEVYGDPAAWPRIAAANPEVAAEPDSLMAGAELAIPGDETSTQAAGESAAGTRPSTPPDSAVAGAEQATTGPARAGATLTVGDLGEVRWEEAGNQGVSRTNGKPSVGLVVYAARNADVVRISEEVTSRLDGLSARLESEGTEVIVISDQAWYINQSLDSLTGDAIWGGALAILVIALFLRSLRSTAVIALSVPASLLLAAILMVWQGLSLNLMTLGGLAVSVGRLVDDAIVVLESVYRHRQLGEGSLEAASNGAREVGSAVVSSTLTTVVVFLPLAFVGGIVGEFFRPFALTASLALLASMVVALTIIPVLGSLVLGRGSGVLGDNLLQRAYTPIARWALRHRVMTLISALVISLGSLLLLNQIEQTFLPPSSEKLLQVRLEMPAGTPATTTAEATRPVEDALAAKGQVEVFHTQIGDTGSLVRATGFGRGNPAEADIFVRLHDDADLSATVRELQAEVDNLDTAATVTVTPLDSNGSGNNRLEIIVTGTDRGAIDRVADDLVASLREVEGLANVRSDAARARQELDVDVDPARAAARGLTPAQVGLAVRDIIAGQQATTVEIDRSPVAVLVRLDQRDLGDPSRLAGVLLPGTAETTLGDVADVRLGEGPVRVSRRDREEAATITGAIVYENTGPVNERVQRVIDGHALPEGVALKVGGVAADQVEGFSSLGLALVLAIGLVYLTMVITIGSVLVPAVILASLPLAAVGALASLYFTGRPLGMSALIGLLMLIGIIVTNAIVLMERVRQLRAEGTHVDAALLEAGRTRVRPILMTALTTILGLAPLAVGLGGGTLFAQEMSTVVMGGLLTATLLTLVVVPVVYSLAQRGWRKPAGV